MTVLILGGDGYLGWPTAMDLAAKGHEVVVVDNYLRRTLAIKTNSEALIPTPRLYKRAEVFEALTGNRVRVFIGDCTNMHFVEEVFQEVCPDAVIHYAEQPSAPYSMIGFDEAQTTLQNNVQSTFNLIWCIIQHAPQCQIIKLGTMGEYGTPNIDIEEGWIDITHNGRTEKFLYPRSAGSLYHTSKIIDTDLLWFYTRLYGLCTTDLMQGPVYGLSTIEADISGDLVPNFHYDDIFGTVVNRFLVQSISGTSLTVYGEGKQTRGYINIKDTLQCINCALSNPVKPGEMRILNQITETFTIWQIAKRVQQAGSQMGLSVEVSQIENPREEKEEHYYNPTYSGLCRLGLKPHLMTEEVLVDLLERIRPFGNRIDGSKFNPRVSWRRAA